MSTEHEPLMLDERTQRAVEELKAAIAGEYPTATFELARGQDDPASIHLTTTVDLEDAFEVLDKIIDRVVDLQVEAGIPLHVIPVRPPERVRAEREAQRSQSLPRRRTISLSVRPPLASR